ncbi:MAG: hypothetical protein AAF770_03770 [Bacteroidota bacterium]
MLIKVSFFLQIIAFVFSQKIAESSAHKYSLLSSSNLTEQLGNNCSIPCPDLTHITNQSVYVGDNFSWSLSNYSTGYPNSTIWNITSCSGEKLPNNMTFLEKETRLQGPINHPGNYCIEITSSRSCYYINQSRWQVYCTTMTNLSIVALKHSNPGSIEKKISLHTEHIILIGVFIICIPCIWKLRQRTIKIVDHHQAAPNKSSSSMNKKEELESFVTIQLMTSNNTQIQLEWQD